MTKNYKSCPLKKRPIIFVRDEDEILQQQIDDNSEQMEALDLIKLSSFKDNADQPQDLSLKRKADETFEDHVAPTKRVYVLNLSNKSASISVAQEMRPTSPAQDLSGSSVMLSPSAEMDANVEYKQSDVDLRGLTATTNDYTSNPYQAAFVMAAGCSPMGTMWNTYQSKVLPVFPSPELSIASSASPRSSNVSPIFTSSESPIALSASPRSAYSYQHFTPPASPSSEVNSEPEDLSIRSDIPLPALYHACAESSSSQQSLHCFASSVYSYKTSPSLTSKAAPKTCRFKCDKCSKMYSTLIGLSKHQQFHCPAAESNQQKKQHACQECGKLYTTTGALKMHIRTHTLPCKCPMCGKAFSRPWLLQGHIRTHTGEKPFHCPDCPRSFADRSNLRAHQQTHKEVKKYVCKVCKKSFSRMSLLNKHASSNCTITIV